MRTVSSIMCAVTLLLAACKTTEVPVYQLESFNQSETYSRTYDASTTDTCLAAKKALLGQGYLMQPGSDALHIIGNKKFQQDNEHHIEITTSVTCTPEKKGLSQVFANAVQDRYTLKKTNSSASVGLSVLGSLSMPVGAVDDSLVKTSSMTITSAQYYQRLFDAVSRFIADPDDATEEVEEVPATSGK